MNRPPPDVHTEGVDGSSPSEGFAKPLQIIGFVTVLVAVLTTGGRPARPRFWPLCRPRVAPEVAPSHASRSAVPGSVGEHDRHCSKHVWPGISLSTPSIEGCSAVEHAALTSLSNPHRLAA